MARRTLLITYIATYLLAVGSTIRYMVRFKSEYFWSLAPLLGSYLALLIVEPLLIRRNRFATYIYLIIQIAIIVLLSILIPDVDFWATLFFPLIVQVMHNFTHRTGFILTGIFALIMTILMLIGPGPEEGLPLILINGVVFFLLAAFLAIIREAETTREEIEKQQVELRAAHEKLQITSNRAEELAVIHERNRLARELHDSVTQSLYSLTLFTEAARHMAEEAGENSIEQYIRQIGVIGQQALKEMRLLVYELQPIELKKGSLEHALQKRLEAVEGRAGVEARMDVDEIANLPGDVELALYRIAQEALNNSLKHAAATSVVIYLRDNNGTIEMEIVDDGVGFSPEPARNQGGLGLKNIRERAEEIGGSAKIRTQPGEGTSVKVTLHEKSTDDPKLDGAGSV